MDKTFETEVLTRLAVIEAKIDDYKETKTVSQTADNRSKQNEKRISSLEERNKWLARAMIGAVICEVIGIGFMLVQIGLGVK